MSAERFPVGLEMNVSYPYFRVAITLLSSSKMMFEIKDGPYARTEVVDIQVVGLGNSLFMVSWQEKDGATVTNLQDYDRCVVHSNATLSTGKFLRMTGTFEVTRPADVMNDERPQRNKALVLDAMTALFQRRDFSSVDRLYASRYIQHNPQIPQGREALKQLVAQLPIEVFYEPGLLIAEGDLVVIHGRIRGWASEPQVVVDIFRIEDGKLAEHWDVLQDEVPVASAIAAVAMFNPDENRAHAAPIRL